MEGIDDLNVQDTLQILSNYVPVNTRTLEVASGISLKKGDRVMVARPSGKRSGLPLWLVTFLEEELVHWVGKKEIWI